MQKTLNFALGYLIFWLASGFYYREITKWLISIDTTTLWVVHTHALALGMIFLLIVAIFQKLYFLGEGRSWKIFFHSYNTGLILTLSMLLIRGTTEVLSIPLSKAMNASIAGISGIGHILLTIGLISFFIILKKAVKIQDPKQ
jgi:hypothetical protein